MSYTHLLAAYRDISPEKRPVGDTMKHHVAFALVSARAALARAWGYLVLSDSYLAAQSPETVASRALGEGAAASYRLAERDVADSIDGLRERGRAHARRLAQRRRTRLESEIVGEFLRRNGSDGRASAKTGPRVSATAATVIAARGELLQAKAAE